MNIIHYYDKFNAFHLLLKIFYFAENAQKGEIKMGKVRSFMSIILLTVIGNFGFADSMPSQSVNAVWNHHIEAWSARDLDKIISDYNDESIMIVNGQVFKSKMEIRRVFQRLFEIFDNGSNRIDPVIVAGRVVYITWHFQPQAGYEFYGTDTFVIENGKITVQTIASPLYDYFPINFHWRASN